MRKNRLQTKVRLIFSVAGLMCLVTSPSSASNLSSSEEIAMFQGLGRGYTHNLDISSRQHAEDSIRASAEFDTDSERFHNFTFTEKACSPQTELDFLDALCTTTVVPSNLVKGTYYTFEFKVGKAERLSDQTVGKFRRSSSANSRENFFRDAFHAKFHAIPIAVLDRYPGVFSYDELAKDEHTRFVSNNQICERIVKKLREPWLIFLRDHRKVSRSEILNFERLMDRQFADILKPLAR